MADIKLCTHCDDSGKHAYPVWRGDEIEYYIEEDCQMCEGPGYSLLRGYSKTEYTHKPGTLEKAMERMWANVKAGKRPLS